MHVECLFFYVNRDLCCFSGSRLAVSTFFSCTHAIYSISYVTRLWSRRIEVLLIILSLLIIRWLSHPTFHYVSLYSFSHRGGQQSAPLTAVCISIFSGVRRTQKLWILSDAGPWRVTRGTWRIMFDAVVWRVTRGTWRIMFDAVVWRVTRGTWRIMSDTGP